MKADVPDKSSASAPWDRVARLLQANPGLYADLMEQWGPKSDDPDGFTISPLLQPL